MKTVILRPTFDSRSSSPGWQVSCGAPFQPMVLTSSSILAAMVTCFHWPILTKDACQRVPSFFLSLSKSSRDLYYVLISSSSLWPPDPWVVISFRHYFLAGTTPCFLFRVGGVPQGYLLVIILYVYLIIKYPLHKLNNLHLSSSI